MTRTLEYHPHAHLLVTAGGLSSDGSAWIKPAHPRFLVPGYALSEIFRAKMRDALRRADLDRDLDLAVPPACLCDCPGTSSRGPEERTESPAPG